MNTNYPNYLLAESNLDLINLFRHLQKEGESFIQYCQTYFSSFNNTSTQYYLLREQLNTNAPSRKRSAIFLYLNRHGYNGLCRYSQKGIFNVPFGCYKKPYFPSKEMLFFHQKSQCAIFSHNDFRLTFTKAIPGDIIYCDPPYAPLDQNNNFTAYTKNKFREQEQIILAKLAIESANRGITVIISNHDTQFTRHHYQGSDIISFPVKRSISCNGKKRLSVQELLAVFR